VTFEVVFKVFWGLADVEVKVEGLIMAMILVVGEAGRQFVFYVIGTVDFHTRG